MVSFYLWATVSPVRVDICFRIYHVFNERRKEKVRKIRGFTGFLKKFFRFSLAGGVVRVAFPGRAFPTLSLSSPRNRTIDMSRYIHEIEGIQHFFFLF